MDDILFGSSSSSSKRGKKSNLNKIKKGIDIFGDNSPKSLSSKKQSLPKTTKSSEKIKESSADYLSQIDPLFDSSTPSSLKKNQKQTTNYVNPLIQFYQENPNLKKFYSLVPITEFDLSNEQKKERVQQSCIACRNTIVQLSNKIPEIEDGLIQEMTAADSFADSIIPQPYDKSERKKFIAFRHFLVRKEPKVKLRYLNQIQVIMTKLIQLTDYFSQYESKNELRISVLAIENMISSIDHIKEVSDIQNERALIENKLLHNDNIPDIRKIIQTCRSMFNESQRYYPEYGIMEKEFSRLLYSKKDPCFQKGLDKLISHPEFSGKILIKLCEGFTKDQDEISLLFLLMCRWAFSCLYISTLNPIITRFMNGNGKWNIK